jgi:hypothetical protein
VNVLVKNKSGSSPETQITISFFKLCLCVTKKYHPTYLPTLSHQEKPMINSDQIKPEMPVVCSEDGQFAVVDHMVDANTIKLNRDKTGQHHYIPLSWVTSTEGGKVKVDRPGDEAMEDWSTTPPMT